MLNELLCTIPELKPKEFYNNLDWRARQKHTSTTSWPILTLEVATVLTSFIGKRRTLDAGYAALDNGSVAPLSKLFDIASLADQPVITGHGYGDDYLFAPRNPEKKQAIEDLLTGENLIWEIVDTLPKHIQLHK
jgi:hypothetical protein